MNYLVVNSTSVLVITVIYGPTSQTNTHARTHTSHKRTQTEKWRRGKIHFQPSLLLVIYFSPSQTGSETQQRKRKAPVPPAAPNDLCVTSVETRAADAPAPLPRAAVVYVEATQSVEAAPVKTRAEPPRPTRPGTPTSSSMSSSSSSSAGNSGLATQDSSSELSRSIDDSDQDQDQDPDQDQDQDDSRCSSSASSSASGSVVVVQRVAKTPSSCGSNGDPELNLKLDEVENRHSAVGKYQIRGNLSVRVHVLEQATWFANTDFII